MKKNLIIVRTMKLMLSARCSHFSMRAAIAIIEAYYKGHNFVLSPDAGVFKSVTIEDIQDLLHVEHSDKLKMSLVTKDDDMQLFELCVEDFRFPVRIPLTIGRKKTVKKDDEDEFLYKAAFDIWCSTVGADKNVFKQTPKYTTSINGRKSVIKKAFNQGFVENLEEVRLVCRGCLCSPYHMGYLKDGQKNNKAYCDLKHLLLNRQRVEEMKARANNEHYLTQLERIWNKNSRKYALLAQIENQDDDTTKQTPVKTDNLYDGFF